MKNSLAFESRQIKGKGRGKFIGFRTINLEIPKSFSLKDGVYAVWVKIDDKKYKGALHFGSVPTFNEPRKSLEVFLIDVNDRKITLIIQIIKVEIIQRIRDVIKFNSKEELRNQIKKDIQEIKKILQI